MFMRFARLPSQSWCRHHCLLVVQAFLPAGSLGGVGRLESLPHAYAPRRN